MNIEDDRKLCACGELCAPDIQEQAVFVPRNFRKPRCRKLRAGRAKFGGFARACPWRYGLWWFPAQIADGRSSIGHAEECDFILRSAEIDSLEHTAIHGYSGR